MVLYATLLVVLCGEASATLCFDGRIESTLSLGGNKSAQRLRARSLFKERPGCLFCKVRHAAHQTMNEQTRTKLEEAWTPKLILAPFRFCASSRSFVIELLRQQSTSKPFAGYRRPRGNKTDDSCHRRNAIDERRNSLHSPRRTTFERRRR